MGDGIRAVMALDTDGHRFVTEATVSSWKMGDPLGMTITYRNEVGHPRSRNVEAGRDRDLMSGEHENTVPA